LTSQSSAPLDTRTVRIVSRIDPKRLSLHAGTLRPVQRFEEKAELVARAGFGAWALRGVELEAYLAEGRTIADARRLNEERGLAISETGSLMQWQFTGGVPLLNTFQRPSGVSDDQLRSRADRLLGWTRDLGCDLVAAIAANEADGTVDEAVRDFRRVCDMAARHRVRVALEVLGFGTHFHTLAQAWEVVRRAECENGGLLLDTYHFHRGGSTLEMLDAVPGDRLYLVHLADVPPGPREEAQDDGRLPPGEGAGPLRDIVKRVLDKGYAGYFVVEVLSQTLWREDPFDLARRCHAGAVQILASV
jgi:sugar phosphate isomerase/epimerase